MTRREAIELQNKLFPSSDLSRPAPNLMDICLDLRSSINGSSDPWNSDDMRNCIKMLIARVQTWDESYDTIDHLVKCIVKETITLGRKYMHKQGFHVDDLRSF